jgi:hypothetical protein
MRAILRARRPALRLLALAMLALGPTLPAAAEPLSPQPVDDPLGLVVPLPGCGMAGNVVSTRLLHRVRAGAPPAQKHRRPAARRSERPAPGQRQADTGALAWQALYGCAAAVPEEAGVAAGARPLRGS